ncbi:uncharacterized protein LOC108089331 isoform X2 [Drosophila ficusphila]|uniref:uncharacterized protein LOC108089331 isoform X2 n=1 Tax=Drosophila ficusphila TaxID=30025 RepID=UPI0007E6AC41|nr:uncharacterized protein LOC108089331 isoform X2 [Drosophila ficusphila]
MSDSNRRQMPVPRAAMMMHHLHFLEEEADESSLEFNENCNQAWRAQFRHPAMASLGVGFEFVSPFSQRLNSSMSTQDEDTENRMIGHSFLNQRCRI